MSDRPPSSPDPTGRQRWLADTDSEYEDEIYTGAGSNSFLPPSTEQHLSETLALLHTPFARPILERDRSVPPFSLYNPQRRHQENREPSTSRTLPISTAASRSSIVGIGCNSGGSGGPRSKRRKVTTDVKTSSTNGMTVHRYGRFGQVEPGPLKMGLVTWSPMLGDSDIWPLHNHAKSLLNDIRPNSYCTGSGRFNVLLQHHDSTIFRIHELVLKMPDEFSYASR